MIKTKKETDEEIYEYFKNKVNDGLSIMQATQLTMEQFHMPTFARIYRIRKSKGDIGKAGIYDRNIK